MMGSFLKTRWGCALIIFAITLLMGCASQNIRQSSDSATAQSTKNALEGQPMGTNSIQLNLTVEPSQLTLSTLEEFRISISATNLGDQVVDPELYRAQLFINDKASMAWGLAISNGFREAKWFALPPGETVFMSWSSMGTSLFPTPGEYTLILRLDDQASDPVHVQVIDD